MAFRFCFVYFTLYTLTNQVIIGLLPTTAEIPDPSALWPIRQLIFWTAVHLFRIKYTLVYKDSGSGDKTFDWVLVFCLFVVAVGATTVWSILDRKRENYVLLH